VVSSYHLQSSVVMFLMASVCMCVCDTITFDSLDVESSFLVCGYIFMGYGSSSHMKVIGSRSRL